MSCRNPVRYSAVDSFTLSWKTMMLPVSARGDVRKSKWRTQEAACIRDAVKNGTPSKMLINFAGRSLWSRHLAAVWQNSSILKDDYDLMPPPPPVHYH